MPMKQFNHKDKHYWAFLLLFVSTVALLLTSLGLRSSITFSGASPAILLPSGTLC